MSEELLINVTPQETRVAYVENGVLQEVHIERAHRRGLVGNVYKGKVSRVLSLLTCFRYCADGGRETGEWCQDN